MLVAVLLVCAGKASAETRPTPCTVPGDCREALALSKGGSMTYFASLPLAPNSGVERAVIVIHGRGRDADRYFRRLVAAARAAGRFDRVLLVAPWFPTADDQLAQSQHYWSGDGWKIGNQSLDTGRVSSFAALDELLVRICGSAAAVFPRLRTVVIAGHSAGAQFVNRYAAGGAGCPDTAVQVRYLIMNPSSYLYVDDRRPWEGDGSYGVPPPGCPTYDDYKYGLRDLNAYMRRSGADRLRRQLFTRRTYYLAGTADTRRDGSLDTHCEADLQGANRLQRWRNYEAYARLFPGWSGATFATVPGVGHDGGRMLMSPAARAIMFE